MLSNWKPEERWTREDRLLASYWLDVGGLLFSEVTFGRGERWPKGSVIRRMDALRFPTVEPHQIEIFAASRDRERIDTLLATQPVEIVEVKQRLNRLVIGQVVVGLEMLEIGYGETSAHGVIVCKRSDPLMRLVCQRLNISVWRPDVH